MAMLLCLDTTCHAPLRVAQTSVVRNDSVPPGNVLAGQSQEPCGIVIEDVALLLGAEKGRLIDRADGRTRVDLRMPEHQREQVVDEWLAACMM